MSYGNNVGVNTDNSSSPVSRLDQYLSPVTADSCRLLTYLINRKLETLTDGRKQIIDFVFIFTEICLIDESTRVHPLQSKPYDLSLCWSRSYNNKKSSYITRSSPTFSFEIFFEENVIKLTFMSLQIFHH